MNNMTKQSAESRMQQLREQNPWLEEYEIEALFAAETGVDPSMIENPGEPSAFVGAMVGDYSAIAPDMGNRYGAYSPEKVEIAPAPAEEPASNRVRLGEDMTVEERLANRKKEEEENKKRQKLKKIVSKNISKEVNHVGATLLIYVVFTFMLGGVCAALMIIMMGWDINELYAYITEPLHAAVLQGALMFIALALPFVFYVFVHRLPIGDMIPLRRLRSGELLPMVAFGLGVMMLDGYFQNALQSGFAVTGANYSYNTLSLGTTGMEFTVSLACLSLIPALVETMVFNGIILQVFRRRGGDSFALIISSLLYALMYCNFYEMPGAFVSSIALGYLVIFSGSILPAAAVRLVERVLFIVITQIGFSAQSVETVAYFDLGVTILLIIAAIFGTARLLRNFPDFFVVRSSAGEHGITLREKLTVALTRPVMMVIIVYSLTFAILQIFPIEQIIDFSAERLFG